MPNPLPSPQASFDDSAKQLFDEQMGFVWRVLRRSGVRDADLDDLTVDVLLIAHTHRHQFEGRSSLRTWLLGISRNVANNYRKSAKRRELPSTEEIEHLASGASDPHAIAIANQALQHLEEQLASLPAEQREAFILYEIEEFDVREIAESMRCPVQTVYSRLRAAREAITGKSRGRVA